MATQENDVTPLNGQPQNNPEIDLSAPQGWTKKIAPKKGGTPRRKDIIFVSPTGDVIKSKRQLEQYLNSHPGGPSASEFNWGTGETPRRSSRISEKAKAVDSPESEPANKRAKTGEDDADEDNEENEDEAATEQTEAGEETELKVTENVMEATEGGISIKESTAQEGQPKNDLTSQELNGEDPRQQPSTENKATNEEHVASNDPPASESECKEDGEKGLAGTHTTSAVECQEVKPVSGGEDTGGKDKRVASESVPGAPDNRFINEPVGIQASEPKASLSQNDGQTEVIKGGSSVAPVNIEKACPEAACTEAEKKDGQGEIQEGSSCQTAN